MQAGRNVEALLADVATREPFVHALGQVQAGLGAVFDHTAPTAVAFTVALCLRAKNSAAGAWIVAPHERALDLLTAQLPVWGIDNALVLPEQEACLEGEMADPELAADRLQVLHRIAAGSKPIVLLTEAAWCGSAPSRRAMHDRGITLNTADRLEPEELISQLSDAGFEGVDQVIARGQWSHRGGIVDVFPLQASYPIRVEFFDDEIESIREFNIDTQISFRRVNYAKLVLTESANAEPLQDWVNPADLIISTPFCRTQGAVSILTAPLRTQAGQAEDFSMAMHDCPLGNFEAGDFVMQETRRELAEQQITQWLTQGWRVFMFFPGEAEQERFWELCSTVPVLKNMQPLIGDLPAGFSIPHIKTVVLSWAELFGRYPATATQRRLSREDQARRMRAQSSLQEINPGDLVVHSSYGIGKFINISISPDSGDEEMNILYANNTTLHVPLNQAHLVSRYVGLGNKAPELNKLNDTKWRRIKQAAQRSVVDYAAQLLDIQSERSAGKGYSHPPDSKWMVEFENSFPFRETRDQLRAIAQTKEDMESPKPMDRLICGDVGFGKTEVAIRAAFKCITGGKQVIMLVPTTVLAEQHRNTFQERMSEYPVRIEMLSRFAGAAETRSTLAGLADGSVDIVIGTHRLIADNVQIKNPGLVIIDEEQRFGVKHKEKLKQRFRGIDVLTLSATPIPRTLYIALMGARDMSSIETPPANRQPVHTSVSPYDERIIKKAIERELERGGQVFILHNRVKTIELFRDRIHQLVPQARIAIGHGQMPKDELEQVMRSFVQGKADILLATTIIESGIDIPNANTIIIDRADRFGLADLYQLRGRVGRAGHKAYAYLMLPRAEMTTSDARKRVSAIKQYTELGSGFKIAMRDLEIRGAGNLLGTQQSGHIAAIGFDLYCRLLQQTIAVMQGKAPVQSIETHLRLDFAVHSETQFGEKSAKEYAAAFLPRQYIETAALRIAAYKDLAATQTIKDTTALLHAWQDRYGKAPQAVLNAVICRQIKLLAAKALITQVEVSGNKLMLTRSGDYILINNKFPRLTKTTPDAKLQEVLDMLQTL